MHDYLQPRPQFDGVHGGDIVLEETVADSGNRPEPLSPNDELDVEFVSDVNKLEGTIHEVPKTGIETQALWYVSLAVLTYLEECCRLL